MDMQLLHDDGGPAHVVMNAARSLRFFEELCTCLPERRPEIIASLRERLLPKGGGETHEEREAKIELLNQHVLTVARLAEACPFADIRAFMQELLKASIPVRRRGVGAKNQHLPLNGMKKKKNVDNSLVACFCVCVSLF